MDSEIIKVSDEEGLYQDHKNWFACLDSIKVYKEGKYEVQCSTQEVQYAEATIKGKSRLEKTIQRYHQYLPRKVIYKEIQQRRSM